MTAPLVLGRIVWVEIADANGIRKSRPAVVVTPTDAIRPDEPIAVVAVTSRVPDPLPADHVLLPWHAGGHPRTGLNRKCAAVCSWIARVLATEVRGVAGLVPASVLLTILAKVSTGGSGTGP